MACGMTTHALLTQISRAFGPSGPLTDLAQDLADADARMRQEPLPAQPKSLVEMGTKAALYLFHMYAEALPWMEPERLVYHVSELLRLAVVTRPDDDRRYEFRGLQYLSHLLSPDNPPSVCGHLRQLWGPLTQPQRATVCAVLQHMGAPPSSQSAWARAAAHDGSGDWRDCVWPEPPLVTPAALLSRLHTAFPPSANAPWTALSAEEPIGCFLPFATQERMDCLLPALSAFVLREPTHDARPAVLRQLYALLRSVDGRKGSPLLRERLSVLTVAQRQVMHGLVQQVFPGDAVCDVWAQAVVLTSEEVLRRPGQKLSSDRRDWLKSVRSASGQAQEAWPWSNNRDYAPVALAIEAAFDGVPAPGPGERTLFDAENADNPLGEDVANGRVAHRGRWQDLPFHELRDCDWALPGLSPNGLKYYVPAVMTRNLHWLDVWSEEDASETYLGVFGSLSSMLSPSFGAYQLRDYDRARYSVFTMRQRRAIYAFLAVTGGSHKAESAWRRVVEHDVSGGSEPWFEVLWPERERPDVEEVCGLIHAAFDLPDLLDELDSNRDGLSWVLPDQFAPRFAQEALFILRAADGPKRKDAIDRMVRALHPYWGHESQPEVRARLGGLTPSQRRAVSAVCDACVDNSSMRQMWRSAIEHDGDDWFEFLKMP
jgi:hypothetical protein